jgi:hypothetical protein
MSNSSAVLSKSRLLLSISVLAIASVASIGGARAEILTIGAGGKVSGPITIVGDVIGAGGDRAQRRRRQ